MSKKGFVRAFLAAVIISTFFAFPSFAGEWRRDNVGWWYLVDGYHYYAGGIQEIDGSYYMFSADGYMMTGWQQTSGGDWYYAHPDGRMAINEWVGEYYIGDDGRWVPDMSGYETSDICGHYSTEGYYGHTANHHIMMDIYEDLYGGDNDIIIEFGLFDYMGNTGDYYDRYNPNGDRISATVSYSEQGIQAWGRGESDGKKYHITYDGKGNIELYWRNTGAWDVNGEHGVQFKKRDDSSGYYGNGYYYSGGGVG